MKNRTSLLLFGIVLAFFISICYAQQDSGLNNVGGFDFDLGVEEETAKVTASPDVSTATVFPRFVDGKFPAGSEIEILMGFRNKGSKSFNITSVDASFNYPLDYNYYIQNFTEQSYGLIVNPYEEVSLSYTFYPDPLLEMRDFGLVVSVHYHDGVDSSLTNYTSVLFNSTVDMVEPEGGFDAQTFFAYLAILAVLGLISYILYRNLSSWTKSQKRSGSGKGERASGAGAADKLDNDWLTGTSADPSLNKRKGGGGGSPNVKNSPSSRKVKAG